MLKKLLKHDFRALSRTLVPMQIGVLGGGLVATLLTALTLRIGQNSANAGGSALLRSLIMGLCGTASVLIGVAIMASALVTLLLICYHFYRSFLAGRRVSDLHAAGLHQQTDLVEIDHQHGLDRDQRACGDGYAGHLLGVRHDEQQHREHGSAAGV
ncbi:MAG: hypothetical protein R2912_01590 [Eubacteriales bacterium]